MDTSDYTVLLASNLTFKQWLELTDALKKAGVSTFSKPTVPVQMNVYVREEDRDLLD